MKARILSLAFTAALLVGLPAEAQDIKGKARVVDGETLYVGQVKIRLNGIDAPERGHARFRAATQALRSFVAGKVVVCRLSDEKSYDRYKGSCYADGYDLAASVLATSNAPDCRRYSGSRYKKFETEDARRHILRASCC